MVHHGTDVDTSPSCRAGWVGVPTAAAGGELDSESEPRCGPEITIVIATRNRRGERLRPTRPSATTTPAWLRRPARLVVKRTAAAALAGHESRRAVGDALAAMGVVLGSAG